MLDVDAWNLRPDALLLPRRPFLHPQNIFVPGRWDIFLRIEKRRPSYHRRHRPFILPFFYFRMTVRKREPCGSVMVAAGEIIVKTPRRRTVRITRHVRECV